MATMDVRLAYENLDRAITTEMRAGNMDQGHIRPLYERARGENPITYDITQALLAVPRGRVAVVTGIVLENFLPKGEIDGPIGAAVLARVLERLGHEVDILMEEEMDDVGRRLVERLGLKANLVSTSGLSVEEVRGWADRYVAAFSVEKLGKNSKGIRHSIMGSPLPESDEYMDDFFAAMNEQGKLTVGMGDGGNEIGFGKIYDAVREIVPKGADCGCGCGGGIATTAATQYMFPVAVSNYGAYAIAAGLALHFEDKDYLVDGDTVIQLIEDAVAEGCLDGGTADPEFIGDDGIPGKFVHAMVTIIEGIVHQWLSEFNRDF